MKYHVISADDHVCEPPDVFERRLPRNLLERAPKVKRINGEDKWCIADRAISVIGAAKDNFKVPHEKRGLVPKVNYDTCEPGIWKADARLNDYDADGIDAAVLFADVFAGFSGSPFWSLGEDFELRLGCVRAWNDWLLEDFCAVNPARLIPLCLLPVWDVEESVKELRRCARKGYRGILWGGTLDFYGLPTFFGNHWDPIWAATQDTGMVVCMHQQGVPGDRRTAARPNSWTEEDRKLPGMKEAVTTWHVALTIVPFIDVIASGMLERFPRLQVFLGEGGVGWIPYVIEQADYVWKRNKSWDNSPLTMPPSEYWRRQCFASFWYERIDSYILEQLGTDNVLYEDDYPHMLCDNGIGRGSQGNIEISLQRVSDPLVRHKILAGNAIRLFGLERYV